MYNYTKYRVYVGNELIAWAVRASNSVLTPTKIIHISSPLIPSLPHLFSHFLSYNFFWFGLFSNWSKKRANSLQTLLARTDSLPVCTVFFILAGTVLSTVLTLATACCLPLLTLLFFEVVLEVVLVLLSLWSALCGVSVLRYVWGVESKGEGVDDGE